MLLVGGLSLSFDHETTTQIKRFISSAFGKIYKLRTKKLRELEAQWLTSWPVFVKFTILYIPLYFLLLPFNKF